MLKTKHKSFQELAEALDNLGDMAERRFQVVGAISSSFRRLSHLFSQVMTSENHNKLIKTLMEENISLELHFAKLTLLTDLELDGAEELGKFKMQLGILESIIVSLKQQSNSSVLAEHANNFLDHSISVNQIGCREAPDKNNLKTLGSYC